jgi:hypothetical protein
MTGGPHVSATADGGDATRAGAGPQAALGCGLLQTARTRASAAKRTGPRT